MSSDDQTADAEAAPEPHKTILSHAERGILSRREFLTGLGAGALGGTGMAGGLTHPNFELQSWGGPSHGKGLPTSTRYYIPAVDASDSGLVVVVNFSFADGNGELFVNVDDVEIRHDLQLALREAIQTATDFTGYSLANTATYVTFETRRSDISVLRGKSWEAGLTVALVASLRRQPLPVDTLITGVVDDEGLLLPVGGLAEKARAVREFGAAEFLIPVSDNAELSLSGLRITEVRSISSSLDRIL